MKRHRTPGCGYHTIESDIEFEIEVSGYCEPGYAPITNRAPEDCDPGCPDEIEDFHVYLTKIENRRIVKRLDITEFVDKDTIESLKEDLMEDHCDYDDGDLAYEMSVGK